MMHRARKRETQDFEIEMEDMYLIVISRKPGFVSSRLRQMSRSRNITVLDCSIFPSVSDASMVAYFCYGYLCSYFP